MKITVFPARRDLIVVVARIVGRSSSEFVHLALDTGAAETLIKPSVLHKIGYGPDDSVRKTVIRSAVGTEAGPPTAAHRNLAAVYLAGVLALRGERAAAERWLADSDRRLRRLRDGSDRTHVAAIRALAAMTLAARRGDLEAGGAPARRVSR